MVGWAPITLDRHVQLRNSRKSKWNGPTEIAPTAPLNSSRLPEVSFTTHWTGHKNLATLPSLVVNQELGGGNSNIFLIFIPNLGEMIQFDSWYFSHGLKPPTRETIKNNGARCFGARFFLFNKRITARSNKSVLFQCVSFGRVVTGK